MAVSTTLYEYQVCFRVLSRSMNDPNLIQILLYRIEVMEGILGYRPIAWKSSTTIRWHTSILNRY